jgi:D-aminopeptidase
MVRKANVRHANSHHALLTNTWTADVQTLERGIDEFAVPRPQQYHVSLFEMKGDAKLHVNVTHKQETEAVEGWSGPGVSANGFVRNRRFESTSTSEILRSIREMVFAARA